MVEAAPQATTVATLTVTEAEHFRFAPFSGDRNPMHTDAVFARRTLPGAIAAYGMHLLLWALDALAERGAIDTTLSRIRVRFVKWVYLNDSVCLVLPSAETAQPKRVELFVDEVLVATIALSYGTPLQSSHEALQAEAPHPRRAISVEHALETLEGMQGTIEACDAHEATALFPALARIFGPALAAEIASVSYVVGMIAPGLHSIDSRADWTLHTPSLNREHTFSYRVNSVDERFRLARVQVEGRQIRGTVEALVRRPPVQQLSLAEARQRVQTDTFRHICALVIGGSRGVGEATAKLLLAGGAAVTLTYMQGAREAQALTEEATIAGLQLRTAQLDVRDRNQALPLAGDKPYTHLFYFATGPMMLRRTIADAQRLAEEMRSMYVDHFARIVSDLRSQQTSKQALKVFYPSVDWINTMPHDTPELVRAKLAGEALCDQWNAQNTDLIAVHERLPRMCTDQTASVLPQSDAAPADVMLPILRRLAAL